MGAQALKNEIRQKVAVIGMGITGRSCVNWFLGKGYEVAIFDTREHLQGIDALARELPQVEITLGALDSERLKGFDQIVCSPGVSLKDKALQNLLADNIEVIGDVEVFAREVHEPVIAITGSNGKSTVTTLVGEIVDKAGIKVGVAGNIGLPVLDALEQQCDMYVLELSSFQLETTFSLKPKVAVVLNVSPDHMDRYDCYEEYVAAKAHIYKDAAVSVVNRDDPLVAAMSAGENTIGFTLQTPRDGDYGLRTSGGQTFLCHGDRLIMPCSEMKIVGKHNYANALAALAICDGLGIDEEVSKTVLRTFAGLEHRTQLVAEKGGVRWFNDSKGTNVGATIAAVEGMEGPVILIAGGQGKDQDFSPLLAAVKAKAKLVLLYGEDAPLIEKALQGVDVCLVTGLKEAVELAARSAQSGDNVLLSPACASFDMFKNYQERGSAFVKLVEAETNS